jgi:NADH-ubiquinone oxidoreductase chain 2
MRGNSHVRFEGSGISSLILLYIKVEGQILRPNYLNIIKQVFFEKPEYKINPELESITLYGNIRLHDSITKNKFLDNKLTFKLENIVLSSYLTITISILTLIIVLFIFTPQE